jgi:hypothetical protein
MIDIKDILGVTAVILTFIGYIPYIRDILKGKTKPHVYSWLLWGFVTAIAFALQYGGGAGIGAFVTLAASLASLLCTTVFFLALFSKGKKDITVIDTLFLLAALVALGLWLFAKQPIMSTLLVTVIDILGFAPTIRKSWNNPYSETISFYFLNAIRFTLAVLSLQHYNVVTTLYPVTWVLGNGLFALMLYIRQQHVSKTTKTY